MHVKSKRIAVLGLLLAIAVIMIVLSGTIEMSTLFFLAGASFCVGIAVREYGLQMGIAFFIASVILGFLLAPNKIYCITYSIMALYILLSEVVWSGVSKSQRLKNPLKVFSALKYVIFNILYIPSILIAPKLVYQGEISIWILVAIIVGGQIGLFLFEKVYCYFQSQIWGKFRKSLE